MVKNIAMPKIIIGHQFLMQLEIVVFHMLPLMLGIIQINMEVVKNHFTLMMILVGTIQHLVQVMMEVVVLVLIVSLVRLEVNKEHTMT